MFQPRPGLGDLIWHLPVIRGIAAATQAGRVTLITKPSTQADIVLRHDPAIERIVWFDHNPREGRGRHDGVLGLARLVADLRGCRAESCVVLHHGASLARAMALAGIPRRYGYGYTLAQRLWLSGPPFGDHNVQFAEAFEQAEGFAAAAGLGPLPEPALAVGSGASARLKIRLAGLPRPMAVLGIGCHGTQRQWGAARFGGLAAALHRRGFGRVLLLAGSHEGDIADAVIATVDRRDGIVPAIGWPLDEVVALLSEADLFVGNDSGLMNVRAAVGRPSYALFGASGPLRHSAWIRGIVPPAGPRTGMEGITLDQVLDALGDQTRLQM